MRRLWLPLLALLILIGVEEALIAHLAARDGAAVLLAAWEPLLALEFLGMLGLRLGLFLLVPGALVLLLGRVALGR